MSWFRGRLRPPSGADVAKLGLDRAKRDLEAELEEVTVRPRKTDIEASRPALVWTPWRVDAEGIAERAF